MSTRPGDFRGEVAAGGMNLCRGCDGDLSLLPPTAKFCPRCGCPLPRVTIPATPRSCHAIRWTTAVLRGVRSILHGWHPAMGDAYRGARDRSKVVTGYGNALFNLGWRYERGWGVRRNLPEALRCYSKSSKLGNLDATVRLPPVQATAVDGNVDRSLDPPVPVMPIWRSWDQDEAERHVRDAAVERRAYEWLMRDNGMMRRPERPSSESSPRGGTTG